MAAATVITASAPSVPQNLTITPGQTSLLWSVDPPLQSNGSPVLKYVATVSGAAGSQTQTVKARVRSGEITGLTAGAGGTLEVVAVNAAGASPVASNSFMLGSAAPS